MKLSTATTSGDPGQSFTERHGGWILSVCFHVILFAFLVIARQETPLLPIQRNIEFIQVSLTGAESAAALAAAAERPAEPPAGAEPVIAMRNAPVAESAPAPESAVEEVAPAADSLSAALRPLAALEVNPAAMLKTKIPAAPGTAPGEGSGVAGNPNAGGSTETGPGAADGQYAPGARSRRGEGSGGDGTEAGVPGSAVVGGQIQSAQVDLAAQKTLYAPQGGLFAARGASAGAIRSIDLDAMDGERAKEVFARYGITIMMVPAGANGREALGRGTGQDRFVTRFGRGGLAIFRFSSVAANRMGQLEDAALRQHGDDPAQTRIVRVTFGIVATAAGGYDLGVIDMKTEPLVVPRERTVERQGD